MSCLFNSLSYFLSLRSDASRLKQNSNTIRQTICDYLQENKPIIDGLETSFILSLERENYIQHMRSTSTWGGAIEIQCACNIWNLRIIVKNRRGGQQTEIEFLPINGNYNNTIYLEWSGGHYEPVRL